MTVKSAGIIGYGHFGAFLYTLIKRFQPELELFVYSPEQAIDDDNFHTLDTVARADLVSLAVPISAYASVIEAIEPQLESHSVVIDIATVKHYTASLLRSALPGARFLSIHPMFGPASYTKRHFDVSGFRIALTDSNLGDTELDALQTWVQSLGFEVIRMSAEEHDRVLAETLFLTHYVGQVISAGQFQRSEIDTVSFAYLMDAVDSVRNDTDLFVDVSLYNPYCAEVIERFDAAEHDVKRRYLSKLRRAGIDRSEG